MSAIKGNVAGGSRRHRWSRGVDAAGSAATVDCAAVGLDGLPGAGRALVAVGCAGREILDAYGLD